MDTSREKVESFIAKVAVFSTRHKLFPQKGGIVLAAVSGGGDSMTLLSVLAELGSRQGFTVVAAHLNHNLRGVESDGDAEFVRAWCMDCGIRLVEKILPPGSLKTDGVSLETAAREARMAFLEDTRITYGADRIATGHSLDDQVETVLQRILRGTGPAGLAGILPMRDGVWIRPLLSSKRSEIREFLDLSGIGYREDSSNNDMRFFRNSLRHELIPYITGNFAPGFGNSIERLAELSRQQEDFLAEVTQKAFSDCVIVANPFKILLDKSRLEDYHNVVKQRIIRSCLILIEGIGRDTDMKEIGAILDVIEMKRGEIDLSASLRFGIEKNIAAFVVNTPAAAPFKLANEGTTALPSGLGTVVIEKTAHTGPVDGIDRVFVPGTIIDTHGPLNAGAVARGERMTPFGMREPVKIRDIIAQYVPKIVRNHIPVIRAGAVPIWIPGIRSSELLRTDSKELSGVSDGSEFYRLELISGISRRMFS